MKAAHTGQIIICILQTLTLVFCAPGFAQDEIIDLDQTESSIYNLKDGFSSICFEKTFQDPTGLLWLKSCAFVGWEYNHHFTTFDGYTPSIPTFSGDQFANGIIVQALGMTEGGIIYGIYSDEVRKENGLFFLNTLNRHLDLRTSTELGSDEHPIVSCQWVDSELILLFANTTGFDIRSLKPDSEETNLIVSERYPFNPNLRPENRQNPYIGRFVDASYIHYYDGNYWILTGGLPFFKYDTSEQSLTTIGERELGQPYVEYLQNPEQPPLFIPLEAGDFIFALPHTKEGAFEYNYQTDTFSPVPDLYPIVQNKRAGISKHGNASRSTAIRYLKKDPIAYDNLKLGLDGSVNRLIMPDAVREVFDISHSALNNTLIATDAGLVVSPNKENSPAKAFFGFFPTRAILPINDSIVLLNLGAIGKPISSLNILENDTVLSTVGDGFRANSAGQMVRRTDHLIWVPSGEEVALIDIQTNTIKRYPNRFKNFERFDLFDDHTLAVFHEGKLFKWNPERDIYQLLYSHPDLFQGNGYVHALRIHSSGDIYIAAGDNLLQIDADFTKHQYIGRTEGARQLKVLSITESDQGKIWMGTYSDGVQVYDPSNGTLHAIEVADGLLSNTVATIEQGKDGRMWSGTFNGVSCIDPVDFKVIATYTEEDGLANNESNRFSSSIFPDGRLVFGSIQGFSVITPPKGISSETEATGQPSIFLSAAHWTDAETGKSTVSHNTSENAIRLPASQRDLRLDLALNVYVDPSSHKYKYKIGDGEWQFAGNNHTLYLNSLVPGNYAIQVRGIDHLGNETANILRIPISVTPFFYQHWWFYLLCALPFLFFAWAWIRRQKRIKKELVIEVKHATAKLREDKVLIESQAQKLQELDKLKSRFFTNISHEFRTPLSVILGIANTLKSTDTENLQSSVNLIQKNAAILLELINQILDLVKLEAGELKLDLIQADIVSFLSQIIAGIKPLAESKNIRLSFQPDMERIMMDIDQQKLFRIIANLLSNAIKFTPDEGEIAVKIESRDGACKIQVIDNGAGISADKLPYIFDRFYQVDSSSTRVGEGTGVGLNLTKELVELLAGSISVSSTLGQGSTFTVALTICNNAAVEAPSDLPHSISMMTPQAPVHEPLEPTEAQADLPNLLIVEDNADIATLLERILSKYYNITLSKNGQEGIEVAKETVPDLILSDVMMPIKDGVQVLDELKNDPITSHIPIVMLTAKADMHSRLEGLRRGADDYISKPFHEEELRLRIKNILAAKQKIHQRYQHGAPAKKSHSPELELEDVFIQKVQKVLDAHLDNSEFGIQDFCAELGVSRMQLHNKLKALTGLSTSHYIRTLRLTKAKEFLTTTDLTVSEVGYAVGFSSHAYFSRSFSEKFGISPTEYRAKNS